MPKKILPTNQASINTIRARPNKRYLRHLNAATLVFALSTTGILAQTTNTLPGNTQLLPPPSNTVYTLGPGDSLTVSVAGLEDFNEKTFLVDMDGNVTFPLTGSLHAAGLTLPQLQVKTAERLTNIIKDPDVVISFASFGSHPISIIGAVSNPGIRQLEGQRTLYEVLSLAGGLRPDAGNTVHITRDLKWGRIPLKDERDDSSGRFSLASVKVKTIMMGNDPEQNIAIRPNDVISVPKAEMVFAVGAVTKPGGFLLTENETISTLQVISLAEGLLKTAATNKAKILRAVVGSSNRLEIPVDVKQLMAGKVPDIPMQSNDILFIPSSGAKNAGYRTLDVVSSAAGFAIGRY